MQLRVDPDALAAASTTIRSAAGSLDDAGARVGRSTVWDVWELGGASGDARDTVAAAATAVQRLATDARHLAQALSELAELYPRVDRAALSRRGQG